MKKVGIIGVGYVGGAVKNWFEKQDDVDLFLYDKYKELGSVEEVNKADIIFISVPTPYHDDSGFDDNAVRDALSNVEEGKIVVIKSTVVPGSVDKYQEDNSNKTLLFNPEFLTQRNANEDFLNPDRQIVGYTNEESKIVADQVLDILPDAPFEKIIKAREAEMVKYFGNTFLAMKVVFSNQMYDLCQELDIGYDSVRECVGRDERIGQSHMDVAHGEKRGYGGACFPKDTNAILELAEDKGINLELLKKMREVNRNLRGEDE